MRNWMLIPLSLLALWTVLEVGLRIAGYNPLGDLIYGDRATFVQPASNSTRIYEGVPHAKGRAWGANVQLNALGLRDREYSVPAPAGVKRIVVIGDSVTFGNYMPQASTYVEQLEALYAAQNQSIEVINLGLGGYDTLQEVASLEDVGLAFKPDLVIVGFCINDIGVASGNLDYILKLKEYGATPLYRLRTAQWVRVQLDRIRLGQEMIEANKAERFAAVYGDYSVDVTQDDALMALRQQLGRIDGSDRRFSFSNAYTNLVNLGRMRYAFERLQAISNREGFPVLVMVIPFLMDEPANHDVWQTVYQMIGHEVLRAGLHVYNPYTAFKAHGFESLPRRANDFIHPNKAGHRLMAEGLQQQIAAKGWLLPVSPAKPDAGEP